MSALATMLSETPGPWIALPQSWPVGSDGRRSNGLDGFRQRQVATELMPRTALRI
jgi:hypothetical protein